MIVMSDDFKKSVSATEREMKGYVEVSFVSSADKSEFTIDNEPEILSINGVDIPDTGLLDDDRKGKNYASLEQDYFLLDGTFVLPNNNASENPGMGYVSKYTYAQQQEEISEVNPFHFTTNATGCSGITVYFQNNKPLDLEFRVTADGIQETFTNIDITDTGIASVTFSERNVTDLYIVVNDVLYPERRLRIQEIDFGLSAIYEGEDLISFKTIEQVSRFADEMPINECEVVLGDYEGKFDVNNPKGITQYLGENVLIKPFVGVVTEDNGIEYCTLGTYWLDEWKNDKNSATLTSKDIFNKLNGYDYGVGMTTIYRYNNFAEFKTNEWGIKINNLVYNDQDYITLSNGNKPSINYLSVPLDSKYNALQKYATILGNTFTSSRNGEINYISIKNNNSNKNVIKDNLQEDPEIKYKEIIKDITVKEYASSPKRERSGDTFEDLLVQTLECNGDTIFLCDLEEIKDAWIVYSYSGTGTPIVVEQNIGDNHIYTSEPSSPSWANIQAIYIKFNYVGTIEVHVRSRIEYKTTSNSYDYKKEINEVGQSLEINNNFISSNDVSAPPTYMNDVAESIIRYRIENMSYKELSCKFNGDPTIECGDCIEVENKYSTEEEPRYDKVWVTKIESEFKGSFNQTIEGDIIEN